MNNEIHCIFRSRSNGVSKSFDMGRNRSVLPPQKKKKKRADLERYKLTFLKETEELEESIRQKRRKTARGDERVSFHSFCYFK